MFRSRKITQKYTLLNFMAVNSKAVRVSNLLKYAKLDSNRFGVWN